MLADAAGSGGRELAAALTEAGVETRSAKQPAEAEHLAAGGGFDVLVFDPRAAGPDFLPGLRRRLPALPLVAWAPQAASDDAAALLEAGVDDVLTSRMGAREWLARLARAACAGGSHPGLVELGRLVVDAAAGEVRWDGALVPLTARERSVLHALAESGGRTVPRETIHRLVWGFHMARGDRSVDVNVKRLRGKLAALGDGGPKIETTAGVGYRLVTGL